MTMIELRVYYNYDARQLQAFRARSEEALLAKVERTIRKDGIHNCDGWTLGIPSEDTPHVTLTMSESAPKEYAWELDDRRDDPACLHPTRLYGEVGSFEEMFSEWWKLALEYARAGNRWLSHEGG